MDVTLVHLRTLQMVVDHGSFSRAAEELRLLERVGKRAFATRAGEILLEHAGRALLELEAARQALERLRGVVAGRLRLGTGATASIYLLPALLKRLRARYPALELAVVTGNAAEIAGAVATNRLDVGIVTLPVAGRALAVSPLCVDPLLAIAPPTREWRGRRSI